MIINLTKFIMSLSTALDYAEKALAEKISLSVHPFHGMRVAALVDRMAGYLGLGEDVRFALAQAAMLHDCALSEYLNDEFFGNAVTTDEGYMVAHCTAGEEIVRKLPLYELTSGAVLYHHERADGKGAFRLKAEETPVYAQLIHMADTVDVNYPLHSCSMNEYEEIHGWVKSNSGIIFSEECADVFLNSIDYEFIRSIAGERAREYLTEELPDRMQEVSVKTLREMSLIFADITDYKSQFTWRHSKGIAEKAEDMGKYYALEEDECSKLYIAGTLHDIGKLLIGDDILEKPGRLSVDEYREIQNHALGTWDMLHGISGLEDITEWAALHHEKLDGSGYPFRLTGDKLDRNSRLMACLDIYQALVEDRPYKAGMSHQDAIAILKKMGNSGQLDMGIIFDIDTCFTDSEAKTDLLHYEPVNQEALKSGYRCPVCGYFLEGELPEDFICPRCEQPGSIFEKIS